MTIYILLHKTNDLHRKRCHINQPINSTHLCRWAGSLTAAAFLADDELRDCFRIIIGFVHYIEVCFTAKAFHPTLHNNPGQSTSLQPSVPPHSHISSFPLYSLSHLGQMQDLCKVITSSAFTHPFFLFSLTWLNMASSVDSSVVVITPAFSVTPCTWVLNTSYLHATVINSGVKLMSRLRLRPFEVKPVVWSWSSKEPLWLQVFIPTEQECTWFHLFNQLNCLSTVDLLDQVCSWCHSGPLLDQFHTTELNHNLINYEWIMCSNKDHHVPGNMAG